MISFRAFLAENEERINFIKKQNADLDPKIIDHYANHDPTANKSYTQWMVRQHKKGDIQTSNAFEVMGHLVHFDRNKSLLPPEQRDINRHDRASLATAAQGIMHEFSKRQAEKEAKKGALKIYDEHGVTIHHLKTADAAKFYGYGTKWCTTDKQHFDAYHKAGPLMVVQGKSAVDGTHRKFQLHFGQDRDKPYAAQEDDTRVDPLELHMHFPHLMNAKPLKEHGRLSLPFIADHEHDEHVTKMARSSNTRDVAAAAEHIENHPHLQHLWDEMANHGDSYVRGAVASRTRNPKTLAKLAQDAHGSVRTNAAMNDTISTEDLHKLAQDPERATREVAHEKYHHRTGEILPLHMGTPGTGNQLVNTIHKLRDVGMNKSFFKEGSVQRKYLDDLSNHLHGEIHKQFPEIAQQHSAGAKYNLEHGPSGTEAYNIMRSIWDKKNKKAS